jgi:hypothetical protein
MMKRALMFSVVLFCAALVARGEENATPAAPVEKAAVRKTIVYYFHGTARCPTCMKLETYTHEAVDESFGDLVKSGRVEWRVVNTDEAANAHFRTDYKLESKSVVLVEMQGSQQLRWKNLEKIWDLVANKDEFKKYIAAEVLPYTEAK